jgi:phage FluMu protein Com
MLLPPSSMSVSAIGPGKIRWLEMRCARCGRLLQKIEEHALRPGKRVEIKCTHCKVVNYSVGAAVSERQ